MSELNAQEERIRQLAEAGRARRARADRRFWILVIGGIATLAIVGLGGIFLGVSMRTGDSHEDGYSVGTLINVREEGVLWSRPAATLLHSGEMKGDEFALDGEQFERAKAFADRSVRVRVKYVHRYVCWAWNYASCAIITNVDEDPGEVRK